MHMTDRGLVALVRHEGLVPGTYLDVKQVWTFGIGHTAAAGPPGHDHHVVLAQLLDHPVRFRSRAGRTRDLVRENALGSGGLQGVLLRIEELLVSAYAGIAKDQDKNLPKLSEFWPRFLS